MADSIVQKINANFKGKQGTLLYTLIACFVANAIATFADFGVVFDVLSPVVEFVAVLLLVSELSDAKEHWMSGFYVLFGIFFWIISDVLLVVYTYFMSGNLYLVAISDTLYLAPNYVFGIALSVYTLEEIDRSKWYSFALPMIVGLLISFVIIYHVTGWGSGMIQYTNEYGVSDIAYFGGVALNLVALCTNLILRKFRQRPHSFFVFLAGLFIYNLFEFRYGYCIMTGENPEVPAIDLIYIFAIVLLVLSYRNNRK